MRQQVVALPAWSAEDGRTRSRHAAIVALVVVLHAGVYDLLILQTSRSGVDGPMRSRDLEIYIVPPEPAAAPTPAAVAPAYRRHTAPPPMPAAAAGAVAPQAAPGAIPPPRVDWRQELEGEARAVAQRGAAPAPRDFGFPQRAPRGAERSSPFAWSHARTHRVEALEGGGMLVNLSDRCILVLMPFPMPFCHIGTPPANGGLFEHMDDDPEHPAALGPP